MTWLDYAVLTILAASILWGVWRGLVHEVVSVAAWVLAFLAANPLAGPLGEAMPNSMVTTPEVRVLVSFVVVFIATLVVCTVIGHLLSKMMKVAGLGPLDRTLGGVFGLARFGVRRVAGAGRPRAAAVAAALVRRALALSLILNDFARRLPCAGSWAS